VPSSWIMGKPPVVDDNENGGLKSKMRVEAEITVQLRYWEGRLEGLQEGIKAIDDALGKTKEKVPTEPTLNLAVEKATSSGWVDALRWVLKPEGENIQ